MHVLFLNTSILHKTYQVILQAYLHKELKFLKNKVFVEVFVIFLTVYFMMLADSHL